jgi:hypothetical protein
MMRASGVVVADSDMIVVVAVGLGVSRPERAVPKR